MFSLVTARGLVEQARVALLQARIAQQLAHRRVGALIRTAHWSMDGRARSGAKALRHSFLVHLALLVRLAAGLAARVHSCHVESPPQQRQEQRYERYAMSDRTKPILRLANYTCYQLVIKARRSRKARHVGRLLCLGERHAKCGFVMLTGCSVENGSPL